MVTLTDILRYVPTGHTGVLDVKVIEVINALSKTVDTVSEQGKSRISLYQKGLQGFQDGFEDGYQKRAVKSKLPYYLAGLRTGRKARTQLANAEKTSNDVVRNSYEKFIFQLRYAISSLHDELGALAQAKDYPYKFLLNQILPFPVVHGRTDSGELVYGNLEDSIKEGLVEILKPYRSLVENLLTGILNDSAIQELQGKEDPDAHIQLGIVYMARGEKIKAQNLFMEAKKAGHQLQRHLTDIASNISAACSIFISPYSRIHLAQQFEMNGKAGK